MIGIGSSVGHYVVRAKLGEGAMGTVYLGQHHVLDARVAIKVIRREAERTEEEVARFFTEARSASRIGHENIVSVLDFGRTADGDPYYIMELLTGESLSARLARGPRPLEEVVHIATQVAVALAESHAKGIVHRDLKPGNVYLVRRGADSRFVKLLDFGVAKLTEEEAEDRGHRTNTGRLLGTPHYMAPEQVAGRRAIDGRADVYALGVLLFEMVCGRLPFDAPRWTEVLIQHVTQAPPRARALAFDCPAWLDRLIDRALAKNPQERPSMAAMRDALRLGDDSVVGELASADTMASPDPRSAGAAQARRLRRRRNRMLIAAVIGIGLGGTALGAAYVASNGTDTPPPASAPPRVPRPDPTAWMKKRQEEMRKIREDLLSPRAEPAEPIGAEPVLLAPRVRPVARPDAGVAVVLPERLDSFDVEQALKPTRADVAACNDRYAGVAALDVTVVVSGAGQVEQVKLGAAFVGTPFALCVWRAISAEARFTPFTLARQEVGYSYGFAGWP